MSQQCKEYVTVTMESDKFAAVVHHCHLENGPDYVIKKVTIKDDLFDDDATYWSLKKKRDEAIKEFEEYQFRTRFNIKTK